MLWCKGAKYWVVGSAIISPLPCLDTHVSKDAVVGNLGGVSGCNPSWVVDGQADWFISELSCLRGIPRARSGARAFACGKSVAFGVGDLVMFILVVLCFRQQSSFGGVGLQCLGRLIWHTA